MRLLIISSKKMLDFGLKNRSEDRVEVIFPEGITSLSDDEIKEKIQRFYEWPDDLLSDVKVVRLDNELIVRPR